MLNLSYKGLTSEELEPLKHFTNLTTLYLEGNQINDLTHIKTLTGLKSLSLASNKINDITPLQDLKNLLELDLSNNHIKNISSLSSMSDISRLNLGANEISDINSLSGLTNLRTLELDNNNISDLTPLYGLINLGRFGLWVGDLLNIMDNPISLKQVEELEKAMPWVEVLYHNASEIGCDDCSRLPSHCVCFDNPPTSVSDIMNAFIALLVSILLSVVLWGYALFPGHSKQ